MFIVQDAAVAISQIASARVGPWAFKKSCWTIFVFVLSVDPFRVEAVSPSS